MSAPAELAEWARLVEGPRPDDDAIELSVVAALQQSSSGGSGSFLARASDGARWWVKPLNNQQGPRVCVNEFVVARMAALIGAPTCRVSAIRIVEDVAGWEFRPGALLRAGIGSASAHVGDVFEARSLSHRSEDDNRRRHAGVVAMYAWMWGADDQWLYAVTDDNRIYSHDHGHYFPGGPNWSGDGLVQHVTVQPEHFPAGAELPSVDPAELTRLVDALRSLASEDLAAVLRSVPLSWPVTEMELASLGYFLDQRRSPVADALEMVVSES